MRNLLLAFCFLASLIEIQAQASYNIKGVIEDTLGNAMIYSTVLLMEKSDSTMVDFTRTELDGSFQFKNVPVGQHIIKSTYIGFIPLTVDASSQGEDLKMGTLQMTEMASELMEVVIKAAKAPIKMRGDTIEYDATTFKVPEGSTVEDLLKRLPGIELESDGSILADGKDVSKVTVDGKSFFGSDPKAATKNLPAEGISKVQVFDTKTEEEKITGSTAQAQDKTMNLELKEDFKSGGFGKVVAGIGTEKTRELKGNYNKFNRKIQFSLVGVANNTGRNGLSWDDYQDFLGSQSFNFSDGGDYGFGGGNRFVIRFSGGNGLESSIQSVFFSGGENGGFPENYNGGINFNYDDKKTKLSSVYYYNQAGLFSQRIANSDKFLVDFVQNERRETVTDDVSKGHRVELELEQELDSLHTIRGAFNGAYIDQDNGYHGAITLANDDIVKNQTDIDNDVKTNGYLANGLILLRKKFKKSGRSMGVNFSYLNTELESSENLNSTTNFVNSDGGVDSVFVQNQMNQELQGKVLLKANALYVEPLSKKYFFQTFYNFRNREETGERDVQDIIQGELVDNDFLSRSYENLLRYHRVGSALRYSHNGYNISIGGAYQSYYLNGMLEFKNGSNPTSTIDRYYNSFIPNVSMNFSPVRNSYISLGYTIGTQEPEIDDLQPVVDSRNPIYIREGNAGLTPTEGHSFQLYANRSYPLASVRLHINGRFTSYDNQFSTEETVDENLVTTVKPINIDGGNSGNISAGVSFPIIKNKLKARTRFSTNLNVRPSIVNGIENRTNTTTLIPLIRLSFTPIKDVSLDVTGRYRNTKAKYDLNPSQNQEIETYTLSAELNTKLVVGFFLSADFDYTEYKNDRFGVSTKIPLLNASLYRQILKGKAEVRISIYDALDKNVGFNQGTFGIGISQSETQTLSRYVMLSFTYNMRGVTGGKKRRGWH